MTPDKQRQFGIELGALLNRHSAENDSDTPDFVLAAYLISCLNAFNNTVNSRKHLATMDKPTTTGADKCQK